MRLYLIVRSPYCEGKHDIDPTVTARVARELRETAERLIQEYTGKEAEIIVDYVRSE